MPRRIGRGVSGNQHEDESSKQPARQRRRQQSIREAAMTKDKRMTSHQRRLKWETIFLLDYFEKQRHLSPQDARIVCCLAVHALIEGEQEWDLGASMTMNRQCFDSLR